MFVLHFSLSYYRVIARQEARRVMFSSRYVLCSFRRLITKPQILVVTVRPPIKAIYETQLCERFGYCFEKTFNTVDFVCSSRLLANFSYFH